MGLFFIHIIKSSLCLILFYVCYKALLSKETFFRVNRSVILSIIGASILIPFFEVSINEPKVSAAQLPLKNVESFILSKSGIAEVHALNASEIFDVYSLLFIIYVIGVIVKVGATFSGFIKLNQLVRNSDCMPYKGFTLAIMDNDHSPFSWGKYIFISRNDYDESSDMILRHEMVHLEKHHSVDLLFAEFATAIFWFNPVIYLLKQELKNSHEFEVDDALIKQGINARDYQLLLINKAAGANIAGIVNTFSQAKLSLRIRMMLRKKSNSWAQLKYLCIIALTLVSVIVFARPGVAGNIKAISSEKVKAFIKKQAVQISSQVQRAAPADASSIPNHGKHNSKVENKGTMRNAYQVTEKGIAFYGTDTVLTNLAAGNEVPLCIVNGKPVSYLQFKKIKPESLQKIRVIKGKEAVDAYGQGAAAGAIIISTSEDLNKSQNITGLLSKISRKPFYVFFIDDRELGATEQNILNKQIKSPSELDGLAESIVSIEGKAAIDKYGEKGKNGIIEVYLKKLD